MTTILAFIFVLGVIVIIHELGHFFAARSVGVRVDRFSIGFPPRLFTVNSINGGFEINLFFYKKNDLDKISWDIIKINKELLEFPIKDYMVYLDELFNANISIISSIVYLFFKYKPITII